jgi:hypothetical protein
VSKGARVLAGGKKSDAFMRMFFFLIDGYFSRCSNDLQIAATILENVPHDTDLYCQEAFGY